MFTNPDIINYIFVVGLLVSMVSLYVIYVFVAAINNSFIDDEYSANALQRQHEFTEEFINNKFKD